MLIEDEHFITSSKVLFRSGTAFGQRFAAVVGAIHEGVKSGATMFPSQPA